MTSKQSKYWKGLEELEPTPSFEAHRHNEFPEKLPANANESGFSLETSRRDFLKAFGFSLSAVALASCNKTPVKKALPYVVKPAEYDPGIANYYASTIATGTGLTSVLVKTRDGRPIKIEGNPDNTVFGGGTSAFDQASVLSLYDNGRLEGPILKGERTENWDELDAYVRKALRLMDNKGKQVVVLTNTTTSPSTTRALEQMTGAYNNARVVTYDAISADGMLTANQRDFGKRVVPAYHFDKAKVIISFNADFLATWLSPVEHTRQYVAGRRIDEQKSMSYHMQFEPGLSLTGSNADMRVSMSAQQEGAAILALYNKLASKNGASTLPDPGLELAGNSIELAATQLMKHRGESIVVSASNNPGVQQLVNAINYLLGNYGETIDLDNPAQTKQGNDRELIQLVKDMKAGKVGALICAGTNPMYTYPDQASFKEGFDKVSVTVSLAGRLDETARRCLIVAPNDHFLESWNDYQPYSHLYQLAQPTIAPVFNTRSAIETFQTWSGKEVVEAYEFVRQHWKETLFSAQSKYTDFEVFWRDCVHDGFFMKKKKPAKSYAVDASGLYGLANTLNKSATTKDLEVVVYQKGGIQEGQDSNNPWLLEFPDPVTKACWDNYACVSMKLAKENGWKDGDVINIKANGHSMKLPVLIQPGQRYNSISVAVGFGRDMEAKAGRVVNGIGANAYQAMNVGDNGFDFFTAGVAVEKTGETMEIARTQTHHHIEGRDQLVRDVDKAEYLSGHAHDHKGHHIISLWKDHKYKGKHWAMAIDLNACTGCGSCVVACQAENNVPVVGKKEVLNRREMHWISVDRYFAFVTHGENGEEEILDGEDQIDAISDYDKFENVQVLYQPLMCQHCDNAPCETVCPVAAISHSSEGINQQVYNRCVGTRYCANNCPFKVRRFNWFRYNEEDTFDYHMNNDLGKMVLNPDVTVRSRGVMEKCSLCVQRIQKGKLEAKKESRGLKDGEVKTACQQACPANAIVFGDMNDPESEVTKLINNERNYYLLEELNLRTTVSYLPKVRNNAHKDDHQHA